MQSINSPFLNAIQQRLISWNLTLPQGGNLFVTIQSIAENEEIDGSI